jgi:hypothetical protein
MLKYVNTGIVFQEIPDEVTLAVNLSNCPCRCPGCHSTFLWQNVGNDLTEQVLDSLIKQAGADITCVCFMGGDADPLAVNAFARHVHALHCGLKVGWYSGRVRLPQSVVTDDFDYIKIGPYIKHLGCLKDRTTNQRLYRRLANGQFEDITSRFWKK